MSPCASNGCCWRAKHEFGCNEDVSSKVSSFNGFNGFVPFNYGISEGLEQGNSVEMENGPITVTVTEHSPVMFDRGNLVMHISNLVSQL